MRIAQIAPIAERVPPKKYGGTERVIYSLTEELVKKGHKVTLFASGDSYTSARLISVFPTSLREAKIKDLYGFNIHSSLNAGLAYSMQGEFDVIHDHNPHLNLPAANIAKMPVVMTWHGPYDTDTVRYFNILNRPYVVSISKSQAELGGIKVYDTVYNGLHMDKYPFSAEPKDYLLYVGRIDREKGTHIAIDVAAKLNKKLIIAAKLDSDVPHINDYYLKEVKPRLEKYSDLVSWVGEVDEYQRNQLMKDALCLLHPVTWPEPFGLVLIESMACGTPVVANAFGSIPEIIKDGKTGFVVRSFDEMVEAVRNIHKINRHYCRAYSLDNYSARNMAAGYERVYEEIVAQAVREREETLLWSKTKATFGRLVSKPLNN